MEMLRIIKTENIKYGADIEINPINYMDPIKCVIENLQCNPYARHYC